MFNQRIFYNSIKSLLNFNFFKKVSCGCPCEWGEVNGLSLTSEYEHDCFINDVFRKNNSFGCYIEGILLIFKSKSYAVILGNKI